MRYPVVFRYLHIATFATIFGALFLMTCRFQPDVADISKFEKRTPLNLDAIQHIGAISVVPKFLERYLRDCIPFRPHLINTRNQLLYKFWGLPGCDNIVIGKDNYLFTNYKDLIFPNDIAGGTSRLYSDEQLQQRAEYFRNMNEWLAYRKIPLVLIVVPTKQTIYPEQLPNGTNQFTHWSRADQFLEYLKTHSNIQIVDLRDEVKRCKKQEKVFLTLDTHWNSFAAYNAYRNIISGISMTLPSVKQIDAPYRREARIEDKPDLGIMSRLPQYSKEATYDILRYSQHRLTESGNERLTVTADSNAPRVLVYHDSMFTHVLPFFADHFSFGRYRKQDDFDAADVLKYSPNLVVQQLSEYTLANKVYQSSLKERILEDRFRYGEELVRYDGRSNDFSMNNCKSLGKNEILSSSSDPQIEFFCPTDPRSNKRFLRIEIQTSQKTMLQVFYSKNNEPFSSESSSGYNLSIGFNSLTFNIPEDATRIRVDPCGYKGKFELAMEARVCTAHGACLASDGQPTVSNLFYQGERISAFPAALANSVSLMENCHLEAQSGNLVCTSTDPRLHFSVGDANHTRVIKICVHSPRPTFLQLFYRTESEQFAENRAFQAKIVKGQNEIFFELPKGVSHYRLDPCAIEGLAKISFAVSSINCPTTQLARNQSNRASYPM